MSRSVMEHTIQDILQQYVGTIMALSIYKVALNRTGVPFQELSGERMANFLEELKYGARFYFKDPTKRDQCFRQLDQALKPAATDPGARIRSMEIAISTEADIVVARNQGRQICKDLGFPVNLQIKVATAISELTRNIVNYVGRGTIAIKPLQGKPPGIQIIAMDKGPGISNLDSIMGGTYVSQRGLGLGLRGTKELMDDFEIATGPEQGTTVTIRKYLK
ncbi:ATP-binding protein [bacterium]|nr:ATP-binding protein [bacterium]